MPYMLKMGDERVLLDDVPLEVFADVEKATGASLLDMIASPVRSARTALALLRRAARHYGVKLPDDLSFRQAMESFELVEVADLDAPPSYYEKDPAGN